MLQHLGQFRQQVANVLQMDWSNKDIEKIVVTEYEERGFGGRGAFIDGLGQVRDMVQSHLLQVCTMHYDLHNGCEPADSSLASCRAYLSLASPGLPICSPLFVWCMLKWVCIVCC